MLPGRRGRVKTGDRSRDAKGNPYKWEKFLSRTTLWWHLTYYEYRYGANPWLDAGGYVEKNLRDFCRWG